jgi:hypothetical protein
LNLAISKAHLLAFKKVYSDANNWNPPIECDGKTDWGVGDIANWCGVTVDTTSGNITGLDLSGFGLTGPLSDQIANITTLETLNVSSNSLDSIPSAIGNLTGLTDLNLSGNLIESLPGEIGSLTALTDLNVSKNLITSLPGEIGSLTALTDLNVSKNLITSLPGEIGSLTALDTLDVSKNLLISVPDEILTMNSLSEGGLNISYNKIASAPETSGKIFNDGQMAPPENLIFDGLDDSNLNISFTPAFLGANYEVQCEKSDGSFADFTDENTTENSTKTSV